jgi:beta-glucosidase
LVLLKNGENADKPILPLPKKASRVLVAGSHADNLGYQCGGWTIEWQGLSGNNITSGIHQTPFQLFFFLNQNYKEILYSPP